MWSRQIILRKQSMVTIVPKEIFDELNKNVSEAEPKKQKFDYKDFKKEVFHYSMVKDYLKDKEIKFVGQGSGRTAYMIPKGACVGHEDSAVCLKVADNVKGIAQNKGEVNVIEKFGGKSEPCFPELFGTDKSGNISLLCEIGTQTQDENDFEEFFEDWDNSRGKFFHGESQELFDELISPEGVFNSLKNLKKVKRTGNAGKETIKKVLEDIKKIANEYKKYAPFVSLFTVMFEKDAVYDVALGDVGELEKWAFINRDGEDVLVPIDWGLTEEVKYQYYV